MSSPEMHAAARAALEQLESWWRDTFIESAARIFRRAEELVPDNPAFAEIVTDIYLDALVAIANADGKKGTG